MPTPVSPDEARRQAEVYAALQYQQDLARIQAEQEAEAQAEAEATP